MQKSKRHFRKALALIGIFAICTFFLVYLGIWSSYKHRLFDPVLQDRQNITEHPGVHGITMYEFPVVSDDPNTAPKYSVMMYYPTLFKFNGSYDISQSVFVDEKGHNVGECQCSLRVRPSIFHESEYEWWITDLTRGNQIAYHFKTTENMDIVENDTANDPQTAITKYQEHVQAMLNLVDEYFISH